MRSPNVNFVMLPEEEEALLTYLSRGDHPVWARAHSDDVTHPKYPPAPLGEFMRLHGAAIARAYHETRERWRTANAAYWADPSQPRRSPDNSADTLNRLYIGWRGAVLSPLMRVVHRLEGALEEPSGQPGVARLVGGTQVPYRVIDWEGNELMSYSRGDQLTPGRLERTILSYTSGSADQRKSEAFLRWGKKVLAWVRRWTPGSVPIQGKNYSLRSTVAAVSACTDGRVVLVD